MTPSIFRSLHRAALFFVLTLLIAASSRHQQVTASTRAFPTPTTSSGGAAFAPPIGARYTKTIGLPVIGQQVFTLHILSDNTAHLLVKGMLILDELVTYKINAKGCLNCRLSENALKKLRRFRTSLKEVGYNFETDTPYVKVRTPLPAPVKIHLKRQNDTMDRIASEQSSLLLAADGEEKESDGELNEQSLR